jgi:hypothetical protein
LALVPWIDIADAGYQAGFRGEALATIVALAQPESGRNPLAVNKQVFATAPLPEWDEATKALKRDPDTGLYWTKGDPNGGSFGLIQANGVHDPAATGIYPFKKPTQAWIDRMFQPGENLKQAHRVWTNAGQSFEPWGTFKFGLHKDFLVTAKVALDGRDRISKLQIVLANRDVLLEALASKLAGEEAASAKALADLAAMKALADSYAAGLAAAAAEKEALADRVSILEGKILRARSELA